MASSHDTGIGNPAADKPAPGSARRWLRRLWVLGLLLAGVVLLAPTLVSYSNLRDKALALAMPEGGWKASTTGGSLSWVGGQSLSGLVVTDPEGRVFFRADRVTLDRTLVSLLMDRATLGKLSINQPELRITSAEGRSNLDEFLAGFQSKEEPQAEEDPSTDPPSLQVALSEGLVSTEDTADPLRSWSFSELNLDVDLSAAGGPLVDGSASIHRGAVEPSGAPSGPAAGRIRFAVQPDGTGGQVIKLSGETIPLQALESFVSQSLPGARLDGLAAIDASVEISGQEASSIATKGRLEVEGLAFTCEALQGEVLEAARVSLPWDASVEDGITRVQRADLDAGWLTASAEGSLDTRVLARDAAEALRSSGLRFAADVDLPVLARSLPRTLRLKRDVAVDTGRLTVEAGPSGEQKDSWRVAASLEDVTGTSRGRPVSWKDPIGLVALVSPAGSGARVERFNLDAPFANVAVQNRGASATADFELSLDRLANQASQLIDLGTLTIRGTALGRVRLTPTGEDGFEGDGSVRLRNVVVSDGALVLCDEPSLDLAFDAAGRQQNLQPIALSQASLRSSGESDTLTAVLTQPANLAGDEVSCSAQIQLSGPIGLWLRRLGPFLSQPITGITGGADAELQLGYSAKLIEARDARVTLTNLQIGGEGAFVEPRVELTGDISFDPRSRGLNADRLMLVGSTVALQAADMALALGGVSPRAMGNVAYRLNLERLAAISGAPQAGSVFPRGEAVGQVRFGSDDTGLAAELSISAEPLQLVQIAEDRTESLAWNEPRLRVEGRALFDPTGDRAELQRMTVTGQTLRMTADASVDQLSGNQRVEANGNLEYDPAQLASLIAAYAGPGVQLGGDGRVNFQASGSLQGPQAAHWSQTLNVHGDAGWSGGGLFGMPIGPGRLQAQARDGRVDVVPLEIAVGQGKIQLQPTVLLDPGPQQLVVPAGPLVSNMAISPEVSETILKYLAPILAGTTQAQGQFSIALDGVRMPLTDPRLAQVAGRLDVQSATLSPGPLLQQVATLVQRVEAVGKRRSLFDAVSPSTEPLMAIEDRQITFQVADGRVYHRGLEFSIDGVPVTSSGSVGFDQTLAITFEVPIQEKWLGSEKAFQGLAGQVIQLPVSGTFQRPRIDERAIAGLTQKVIESAATGVLGEELNRQFDKLFKSR